MTTLVNLQVPVLWDRIRDVRQNVADSLSDQSEDLRDAAQMVASELVENAVKYGESVQGCENVQFNLSLDEGQLRIDVSSGLRSSSRLETLRNHIQEIKDAPDQQTLYFEKVKELLWDSSSRGGLGLYRIGCEGRFDLEMNEDGDVVTISAKRALS
jgi:hypothetical protein